MDTATTFPTYAREGAYSTATPRTVRLDLDPIDVVRVGEPTAYAIQYDHTPQALEGRGSAVCPPGCVSGHWLVAEVLLRLAHHADYGRILATSSMAVAWPSATVDGDHLTIEATYTDRLREYGRSRKTDVVVRTEGGEVRCQLSIVHLLGGAR
jgi:hypothetical protein